MMTGAHNSVRRPLLRAGARLQSLVFCKYVLRLGWRVRVLPAGTALVSEGDPPAGAAAPADAASDAAASQEGRAMSHDDEERTFSAAMLYLQSLTDCLEVLAGAHAVFWRCLRACRPLSLHKAVGSDTLLQSQLMSRPSVFRCRHHVCSATQPLRTRSVHVPRRT